MARRARVAFLTILAMAAGLAGCGGDNADMRRAAARLSKEMKGAQWSEPGWLIQRKGISAVVEGGDLEITLLFCGEGALDDCDRNKAWTEERGLIALAAIDPTSIETKRPPPGPSDTDKSPKPKGWRLAYACRGVSSCWRRGDGKDTPAPAIMCRSKSSCERAAKALRRLAALAIKRDPAAREAVALEEKAGPILARLRAATKDHVYSVFYPDGSYDEWVTDFKLEAAERALAILSADEEIEMSAGHFEDLIPLARASFKLEQAEDKKSGAIVFTCADNEACIRRRTDHGIFGGIADEEMKKPRFSKESFFGCDNAKCAAIEKDLHALATLIGESRASSSGGGAGDPKAIIERLKSATNGHVYQAAGADAWILDIALDEAKDRLWVATQTDALRTIKDAWERDFSLADLRVEAGDPGASTVKISCAQASDCIALYQGDGKFNGGSHAKDEIDDRNSEFSFGCARDKCAAIRNDLRALIALAGAAGREHSKKSVSPQQATPSFTPAQAPPAPKIPKAVSSAVGRVNTRVDRNAAPPPGFLPTQGLAVVGGKIALHTDSCAADKAGCGPNAVTEYEIVVQFSLSDINGSSIGYQAAGGGYALVFSCKPAAGACIRSPDGRLQLVGYGIPCKDQTECNRLVLDFSSLLDLAAAQEN